MLTVREYDDSERFWREVAEPLNQPAVPNNVFVGVANRMRSASSPDHLRFGVFDEGRLVLGALHTPPFRLNLADSGSGESATEALARHLADRKVRLPGVVGHVRLAERFADAWCEIAGQRRNEANVHGRRQNLYQIERVTPPNGIAGRMRPAQAQERELLVRWEQGFAQDAGLGQNERDPAFVARVVDETLAQNGFALWEVEGAPVSTARLRRVASIGARISGVYTPSALRGHSYASALTAALSQKVLDEGLWCCLFADAANPLTNRIYQSIGYVKLATFADILFE